MLSAKLQDYKVLINKHKGENAFVVGAGTSLLSLDLSSIHDYVVISVNSGFLLMPWSTGNPDKRYWLSNDALVRRWTYWKDVKKSIATKLVRNSWEKYYDEIPDFLVFWPRHTSEDIIDPKDDGLCYCSSIPTGIDLALFMGVKNIFVLGLDQYVSGNKRYYWQFWPEKDRPKMFINGMSFNEYLPDIRQQRWTFKYDMKAYKALETYSQYMGVKIYNCNPASLIQTFEKISFDKVQEKIDGT